MHKRTLSRSPYMEYAKLRSTAKYNLATSGITNYPMRDLPVKIEDLEINGPDSYGYQPLKERIARLNGVSTDCVVTAAGASLANHLALAATLEPGDEILVEHPTYELIVSTAAYLGTTVRYFERRAEDGFAVDPTEIARQITPSTRLIALTNLHNPSGALVDHDTLKSVGQIAREHDARVLVDEVYLEALFEDRPPTALLLGDHFLVTSSLTKGYGLSGLRCGWVLASPDLCERMYHIHDLYGVNAPHPAELLSVVAFDHLGQVADRAKSTLRENRTALDEFLNSRDDLSAMRPSSGTIAFPKLLEGDVNEFDRLLREKYETSIVPGEYFDMPQYFRIGIGGDPETTHEGLKRLALALDEFGNI